MDPRPLRVLLVEDSPHDVELVLRELRSGGWQPTWRRVDTAESFEAALRDQPWDIVLCDYRMPRFSAPEALEILRRIARNTPFIVMSGVVSEEAVVDLLRSGAHDFMTKDRLARLVPAVQRELEDASLRAERKRIREQLLVSERMATLGLLAAGVGHEINNPLAALVLDIDLAAQRIHEALDRERPAEAPEIREASRLLEDAQQASSRVQQIVRDLHIFARSSPQATERVDLVEVIESVLRLASNEIRHHASIERQYRDVPPLYVDQHRLGQVVLNLVINATQAMPQGHADRNELRITTGSVDDARVFVEVADTGVGIAPEDLPRLFEPLFSTKASGTGLGLSICKRIVDDMGGEISARSEPGRGSTFRVTLPTAAIPSQGATAPPRKPVTVPPLDILVIDDDVLVATAMQALLSAHHETMAVYRAQEALALIEQGARYDVIFCDLMMPQMNGIDLYNELLKRAPDLARRVVFMTGGAFTPAASDFLERVDNPHVQKPFDVEALEAAAQAVASM